jgi:hypothetical protein
MDPSKRLVSTRVPAGSTVIVSRTGEPWKKEFFSLFQAVQFASSMDQDDASVCLTIRDSDGREIVASNI